MPPRSSGIFRDPRFLVPLVTLVAGVSGYLSLVAAAHALTPADNAEFLSVWSALFAAFTVVGGVGLQAAASVSADPAAMTGVPILRIATRAALTVGLVLLLPTAAFSGLIALPAPVLGLVCLAGICAYVLQTTLAGTLAALARWRAYAALLIVEASLRFGLVFVAAVLAPSVQGLIVAVVLSSFTWLLVSPAAVVRRSWRAGVVDSVGGFLRKAAVTSAGSLGPAVLVVGYPVLVKAVVPSGEFAAGAGVLLAVVFTRAPLLMPMATIQPMVVAGARRGGKTASLLTVGLLSVGLAASLCAFVVGPRVLQFVVGEKYSVERLTIALLVIDATLLAVMMILAAIRLAQQKQVLYFIAWAVAVAAAALVLWLPMDMSRRVSLSLLAAPVTGCMVLLSGGSFGRPPGKEPGALWPAQAMGQ